MSYPNPYGAGCSQPYASPYPSSGPGNRLGFENVSYPSGAPGFGQPAPGFNTSGSGYPPYPSSGSGACPPSSGYPQQYGGSTGYPQAPGGPVGYPQPSGGPTGYPQPSGGPAGYPQAPSGPTGYAQSGYPQPGGASQPPISYPGQQPASGYPNQSVGAQSYGGQAPYGGQQPYGQGGNPPYGTSGPQSAYGAPPSGQPPYGAPSGGQPPYGAPSSGQPFGAPSSQPYGATAPSALPTISHGGFPGAPTSGYSAPTAGYGAPTGYGSSGGYGGSTGYGTAGVTPAMSHASFQGTVKSSPSFNPNADCEALKKAMKGLGCDEKAVINVLCYRSNAQRQQIRHTFKTMYGKDLIKELISELRGNFEDLIVALMYTPGEYDAHELRYAMEGAGTTESTLIEIMATRTNAEIRDIKMAYRMMFGRDLEQSLVSETSGYFKRLLVSLCNGGRNEAMHVDPAQAKKSAQDLYSAGVKRWGTDEITFNAVLCSQSYPQLQAVFEEYRKLAGHDIEQAIKAEFSGDIEAGLLAVVKSARNPPSFFAERCYNSMVGMGTNDRALIRAVVTRCEKDMVQIKQEFQRMYGKSLESFIGGDTSGKYKEGLMALVRGN